MGIKLTAERVRSLQKKEKNRLLDLRDNPLSDSAYDFHIPALQKKGVKLLWKTK